MLLSLPNKVIRDIRVETVMFSWVKPRTSTLCCSKALTKYEPFHYGFSSQLPGRLFSRGCQRCNFVLQGALNCLNLKWHLVKHVGFRSKKAVLEVATSNLQK